MDDAVRPVPAQPVPDRADQQAGNDMFGVVAPRQDGGVRAATRVLRRILGEAFSWAVVVVILVSLLAPAAVFLVAGGWALVTFARSAADLYHLVARSQLADLLDPLRALDLSGRVAVASAGYFALLCSLLVLEAGLLGKRWRWLFLVPGVLLTIPSALALYAGLRLTLDTISADYPISLALRGALTLYLVFDTIALAAFLVDLRPKPRRPKARKRRRWLGKRGKREPQAEEMGQQVPASLPLLHFGPPSVSLPSPTTLPDARDASVPAVPSQALAEPPPVPVSTDRSAVPASAPDQPHTSEVPLPE